MDIRQLKPILASKGNKWILAVILLGVVGAILLMDGLLPNANTKGGNTGSGGVTELEARLAGILSSIDGVGTVRVMIYEGKNAVQAAWLGDTSPTPSIVGVVVVAQGAGDMRVRLELVRAVQTLLNIPASAVEVLPSGSSK